MKKVLNFYKELLHQNKQAVKWVTLSFFIFAMAGFGLGVLFPSLMDMVAKSFENKFGGLSAFSWDLVFGIFYNNLKASLLILFGGVVFGIFPIVSLAINGGILGMLFQRVGSLENLSLWQKAEVLLLGILPHGIVELPVLFFTIALGFKLGTSWLKPRAGLSRSQVFLQSLKHVCLFVPLMIILLFVAAILEVFLTGWLLKA
ncbi:MAG: stage II sporulation protein M [Candidatus Doudnabacteria bacterium]|nr:stage II sporulation protein M [Candidatus Doudnabacteria bacterium]